MASKRPRKGYKELEHEMHLSALRNGYRPHRAVTIPSRKRKERREACRDRRLWD